MTHSKQALEFIQINSAKKATHSIIWLHGLGADGHDFEPIAAELDLKPELSVRFVFPHAPLRAITLNNGLEMRAWYDLKSLELNRAEQDPEGVIVSAAQVRALIENEIVNGVPASRIVLAGFSQGSAIALYTALTQSLQLGGIIALSGYLPILPENTHLLDKSLNNLPIFMAHGKFDDVIELKYALKSKDLLVQSGYSPEWRVYNVAHGLAMDEIRDISNWLNSVL